MLILTPADRSSTNQRRDTARRESIIRPSAKKKYASGSRLSTLRRTLTSPIDFSRRVDEAPAGARAARAVTAVKVEKDGILLATDGAVSRIEIIELRDPARLAIDLHGVTKAPRSAKAELKIVAPPPGPGVEVGVEVELHLGFRPHHAAGVASLEDGAAGGGQAPLGGRHLISHRGQHRQPRRELADRRGADLDGHVAPVDQHAPALEPHARPVEQGAERGAVLDGHPGLPCGPREPPVERSRIVAMSFCEPRSWKRILSS